MHGGSRSDGGDESAPDLNNAFELLAHHVEKYVLYLFIIQPTNGEVARFTAG